MKQTFFWQHIRLAAVSVLLLITIAIACRKQDKPTIIDNSFSAAAAKEWYYGTFKKSTEWAMYYESTLSKTDRKKTGKKLPDWENGVYYKLGGMEIMEFPLVKMQTFFHLPADAGLTSAQLKKMAAASLSRIVFIKKSNGKIVVREIDYIPGWSYLEQKGFDISNVTILNDKAAFWGRVIIKDWNGRQMAKWVMENGKLKNSGMEMKLSNGAGVKSSMKEECGILVTEYERSCIPVYDGDQLVGRDCTPWEPTGNQWFEPVSCQEPNPCEGLTDEECACQVFNACNDQEEQCDPNAVYPEQQEFESYILGSSEPFEFEAPTSNAGTDPVAGSVSWTVFQAQFGGWQIKANTDFSYTNERSFNGVNFTHEYNFLSFNTGNGFYVGTHSFITSTYTTTSPTINQIFDNNSPAARGWSVVKGKLLHKASIPLRVPFCGAWNGEVEYPVENSMTLTPK